MTSSADPTALQQYMQLFGQQQQPTQARTGVADGTTKLLQALMMAKQIKAQQAAQAQQGVNSGTGITPQVPAPPGLATGTPQAPNQAPSLYTQASPGNANMMGANAAAAPPG